MKDFLLGEFFKLVKFGITGVMNTLVDFAVFLLLTHIGVAIYFAQVVSYSCGILNSYIVNRSWTFKSKGKFLGPQMVRFIAVNLSLLLLSLVLLWVFTEQLGFIKILAKLCSTVLIMVIGFVVNRLWVFRQS
ncbi:MAG: GtrA family protein [Oscillospiraceae bacterium]|nr:GtrA family protein [Oscillospiraceae bacterium]